MSAAEEKPCAPTSAIAALEERVAALEARVAGVLPPASAVLVAGGAPASITPHVVIATAAAPAPVTPTWWQPASGPMRMPRVRASGGGQ